MSWATHNVEAYEEIEKTGVINKIYKELKDNGFEDMDSDTVIAVVESLSQAKDRKPYYALLWWSNKEVSDAEADHFASIADARENTKENQ